MKKTLISLVFLLFHIFIFSQNLNSNFSNLLEISSKHEPIDQVFLHLDRNLYCPGDTVRFQAYIRARNSGIFETKSISLYVLLVDANYNTIDSARFRIINSTVSGWLEVPDSVLQNNYKVVAFTSTAINYDPEFVFTTQIRIKESLPGLNNKEIKTDKSPTYYESSIQHDIELRFLPEGGTFVTGISQRLGFNAVTSSGETRYVEGVILNQKGEEIIDFKSEEFGPGIIEFIPKDGDQYYANLRDEEYAGVKWKLPVAINHGPALRVNKINSALLDIKVEGKYLKAETYYLSVTKNSVPVFSTTINTDSLYITRLNFEELPAGTLFVSLYGKDFNLVAERLVFVNKKKMMNIAVTSEYNDGNEVELTLNTTNEKGINISSFLSIAVIDSASGYFDNYPVLNMETYYLYNKDFINNLPTDIKRVGLSNIKQNTIDILLLTYGRRRVNHKKIDKIDSIKEINNYDFINIKNPGEKLYRRADFTILSLENLDSVSIQNNKEEGASLYYASLNNNVKQILILPHERGLKNLNPIKITYPNINRFVYQAKRINRNIILPKENRSVPTFLSTKSKGNVDLEIEEIIIKERKGSEIKYENTFEEIFKNNKVKTYSEKEFVGCGTFEDLLVRSNPYHIDLFYKIVYLKKIFYSMLADLYPALFVIDGQLLTDYTMIANMPISQIESVSILNGVQGFSIYGNDAVGGIIYVNTKEDTYDSFNSQGSNDLMKPIRLFRKEVEFYSPTDKELTKEVESQFHPTISWDKIFLDGKGPFKLKFPINKIGETSVVFINGVSISNLVGSESHSFNTK